MKLSTIVVSFLLLFIATSVQAEYEGDPDGYIVVFKDELGASEAKDQFKALLEAEGGSVKHEYQYINGFSAMIPAEALEMLRDDPTVKTIEPDLIVRGTFESPVTQVNPPWGLDRIDQEVGLDNSYTYSETGAGVHVYIIDSGIKSDHTEFTGRLGEGANFATLPSPPLPQVWDDCHGHGTHVSSTAGGTLYGVAKGVTLHAVRVFPACVLATPTSNVLMGMEWVITHHRSHGGESVANMSLVGGFFQTQNDLANMMVAEGIVLVVGAGNDDADACGFSPASAVDAITVAALTYITDKRAGFSNWGTCVDIFAPGEYIQAASITCTTCNVFKSGTSMASPHVAGVAALILSGKTTSAAQVRQIMIDTAVVNRITDPKGSPNLLVSRRPEKKFGQ